MNGSLDEKEEKNFFFFVSYEPYIDSQFRGLTNHLSFSS